MPEILKGSPVALALSEELKTRTEILKTKGIVPTLAILRVGDRPDDISYETGVIKYCVKVGVAVKRFSFPTYCFREQLLDVIQEINANSSIHGCLMFRPLPDKAVEEVACALLDPEKDVDGMTFSSLASVFIGKNVGYPPCTAKACMEIFDHYGIQLQGKRVAVVGRSLVIGKPVSMMLQSRNATVTMCHTKTRDLPEECQKAEILIAAVGKARMIDDSYVSSGQVVIDVGINVDENGNLCGDVNFDKVKSIVSAITPVPGGVGAITTAVLCKHVIEAAEHGRKN